MRVIGYTRVSDREQAQTGYSIQAQTEHIEAWCLENQHHLVQIYTEPGRSGSKPSRITRPTFEHAVRVVLSDFADALVVKWMDRFARNVEDFIRVRSQFIQAGKQLISISEPILNGDPADPVSRYIAVAIMNAYQLQVEITGLKSAQGRDRRAKQGKYPGVPPIGYTRKDKEIVIDDEFSSMILTGFNEFSTGRYTLKTWGKESKRRDYKSVRGFDMNKSAWHRVFRNRFYIGYFLWKGKEYLGEHAPLVDEGTFNEVQKILEKNSTGGSEQKTFWLFSGLLWSLVHQKPMSGTIAKRKYYYYRAMAPNLPEHTIRADELEHRVLDKLSGICWDGNKIYTNPEYRLAIMSSENMNRIFTHLQGDKIRQDFLKMIFKSHGIHIAESGRIENLALRPGFKIM